MPLRKWSKEDKARLIEWHAQGLTAERIAAGLGRAREVVIGKLHRMGIVTREKIFEKPAAKKSPRFRDEFLCFGPLQDITITGGVDAHSKGVSVLEATEKQCRWPLEGKAKDGSPLCCSERRDGRSPYCTFHRNCAHVSSADDSQSGPGRE